MSSLASSTAEGKAFPAQQPKNPRPPNSAPTRRTPILFRPTKFSTPSLKPTLKRSSPPTRLLLNTATIRSSSAISPCSSIAASTSASRLPRDSKSPPALSASAALFRSLNGLFHETIRYSNEDPREHHSSPYFPRTCIFFFIAQIDRLSS